MKKKFIDVDYVGGKFKGIIMDYARETFTFDTMGECIDYADELYGKGNYCILFPDMEFVNED